ncbi:AraC family transcriptional regulator [Vibrio pelagius]|uniref:AraC family transcriptional regulator n=1 Tax=Vibrio pelagius TaxID=28169 RepID=A0ABY5G1M1_VIBPE|nr:AraC family transcriptional regulator [Vibrio pelagius]UTT84032.1 AraC family transcriptional regulator [Vibrio pelagius]
MHLFTPLLFDKKSRINSIIIKKIERFFSITTFGQDISIISKLEVRLVFFIINDAKNYQLLNMAISICENLNKKIIVISNCSIDNVIRYKKSLIDIVNVSEIGLTSELEFLKIKTDHLFNTHCHIESHYRERDSGTLFLTQVSEYIFNHLTADIRESDLAEMCHCSTSYFSKKFHRYFGVCFRDFVCDKRILLAKEIMQRDTDSKIAVIAYQCGYKDVSYFSRIFKKRTGVTPASYRRACIDDK